MKTRIVWTKVWEDQWFDQLSQEARLLFVYLITNNTIGLSGCYELRDKTMCYHTHLAQDQLLKAKEELKPKVLFYENWVYVVNAQGYNGFTGYKTEVAVKRELGLIPQIVKTAFGIVKDYTPSIPHTYPIDGSINNKSEIINHKSEIIKHKSEDNEGRKYTLVGNTMKYE